MRLIAWHRKLVHEGPGGPVDYLAYCLFFPLALLYGAVARIRVALYRSGWLPGYQAPVPVISVGNLSAGGTGKTPVTDLLAGHLLARGVRVAVISRGYGRTGTEAVTVVCAGSGPLVSPADGGDEPVLLARRNPGAIVIAAPDRKRGIVTAVTDHGAEVVLLDDGFQHLKVRRDMDLLLLDARHPFGNGFPLPFGLLREFPSAVDRADAVLLTRSRGGETLRIGEKPLFRVRYRLADYAIDAEGRKNEWPSPESRRIGAFAGIANPDAFFESLTEAGLEPAERLSFPDHVVYSTPELASLHRLAGNCDVLLTTEKDLVKLRTSDAIGKCLAVPLVIELEPDVENLYSLIDSVLDRHRENRMLSRQLLDILACPKCKGEVDYQQDKKRLVCPSCKLAYPVRDGIPVMLVDEADEM